MFTNPYRHTHASCEGRRRTTTPANFTRVVGDIPGLMFYPPRNSFTGSAARPCLSPSLHPPRIPRSTRDTRRARPLRFKMIMLSNCRDPPLAWLTRRYILPRSDMIFTHGACVRARLEYADRAAAIDRERMLASECCLFWLSRQSALLAPAMELAVSCRDRGAARLRCLHGLQRSSSPAHVAVGRSWME